jgi:hypothetical protein
MIRHHAMFAVALSLVPTAFALGACSETVEDDVEQGSGAATASAKGDAGAAKDDGAFTNREEIHLVLQGSAADYQQVVGFDRSYLDASGTLQGAHPEKFVVKQGKVYMTKNFATGEAESTACGTMTIRPPLKALDFTGNCGLAPTYSKK